MLLGQGVGQGGPSDKAADEIGPVLLDAVVVVAECAASARRGREYTLKTTLL
jgi:hypothetical protein